MPDWPQGYIFPSSGSINNASWASPASDFIHISSLSLTANVAWPANNRAIYIPFIVEFPVVAYQMAVIVNTQSGNLDLGIYNVNGVRLVSIGSTAVGAAGFQAVNITDTTLTPGNYYMAMSCSTTAALFNGRSATSYSVGLRTVQGVQDEDLGAVTLPDPATFTNPGSAAIPNISIAMRSTM